MKLRSGDLLAEFMRLRDGMTGAELARAAGISRQRVSQLLHEVDDTCKPDTAFRIARALGVPLEAVWEERHPVSTLVPATAASASSAVGRSTNRRKVAA